MSDALRGTVGRLFRGRPRPVILDTDMNEDCDDAGALAVLHALADEGRAEILGVTYCTSSRWGPPCIGVINRWYGRPDIPVGTYPEPGFLEEESKLSYIRYLAEASPAAAADGKVRDAVGLLRELLAARKKRDVTFVAIGPLVNLQALLESEPDSASPLPGRELIARSVERLVLMGGIIPEGREYNFLHAPEAARAVLSDWPGGAVICGAEIGAAVWTGAGLQKTSASNPVRAAYKLHCGGIASASYDLITVDWAVTRSRRFLGLSGRGRMELDGERMNRWVPDRNGNCRYLRLKAAAARLEERIEALLCRAPRSPGELPAFDADALFAKRKADLSGYIQSMIDENLEELGSAE